MPETVLLIGGSVRSLAESVARAGLRPVAYDLFADWDLQRRWVARAVPRADYPQAFLDIARDHAGLPVIYTGGLENYPELVADIAAHCPLWGNSAEVLRLVRCPQRLSEVLQLGGFAVPDSTRIPDGLPADGSWLSKPLRGTGGYGIQPWIGGQSTSGHYWQRRQPGTPSSALFLGTGQGAVLLGLTEQLIGCSLLHAKPFQYAGTIVDLNRRSSMRDQLVRCGKHLASSFGLRGLFGVDFLAAEDRAWMLEVNPRYTASVEAWEEASGRSALMLHQQIFSVVKSSNLPRVDEPNDAERKPVVIKGVLFAPRDGHVVSSARCYRQDGWNRDLRYADIPQPGTSFVSGEPVLTLMVRSTEREAAWAQFTEEVARLEAEDLTH